MTRPVMRGDDWLISEGDDWIEAQLGCQARIRIVQLSVEVTSHEDPKPVFVPGSLEVSIGRPEVSDDGKTTTYEWKPLGHLVMSDLDVLIGLFAHAAFKWGGKKDGSEQDARGDDGPGEAAPEES